MKRSLLFIAAAFVLFVASLPASGYTVLCSQGPTSLINGTNNWQVIYSCTIPASSVSAGQAIRLTSSLGTGGTVNPTLALYLNGVQALASSFVKNEGTLWSILIINTGATTGEAAGLAPFTSSPWVSTSSAPISGLSWSSSQVLELEFIFSGSAVAGHTFLVEIVN